MSEKKDMWQGGDTFKKYDKMIRGSEDYVDELDCESKMRDSLVERNKLIGKKQPKINDFSKKTPISGMGGVRRLKYNKDNSYMSVLSSDVGEESR